MKPINDQNIIKIRIGQQELRDARMLELGTFALDLQQRIVLRRENKQPEISEIDFTYLKEITGQIAAVHFELLYGKTWLSMSKDYRVRVVDNVVKKIVEIIKQENEDTVVPTTMMMIGVLLQNEFVNHA